MRIAMLHVDLPSESRGGVAHQVSRLADTLARRGSSVTVFTLSEPPPGIAYSVRRLALPSAAATRAGRLLSVPLAFALGRYSDFDVIHAHGDSHFLVRRQVPIVRTFYGSARDEALTASRLRRRLVQRALHVGERVSRRTATYTVGISQATEASIGPLDAIVPCGVDRDLFRPGPKSTNPSIFFVGTQRGRKQGAVLVDLFRQQIRPRLPECELWMVTDEPVMGEGIRASTSTTDDAIAGRFREAWVFASPSRYEGFGVPYIEALASGTPVVTTPNPGAVELLSGEVGGILVPERDLAPTLVDLLSDPDRCRRLGEAGREYSARFDWDRVAAAYEEIYASVARRAPGRGSPA